MLSAVLAAVLQCSSAAAIRCASSMRFDPAVCAHALRRQQRWDAGLAMLEATSEARRRFDHRAHQAQLVGLFVGEQNPGALGSDTELLVAMQPDQGGRKLLFFDPHDGEVLGFIELENRQHDAKLFNSAQSTQHRAPPASSDVVASGVTGLYAATTTNSALRGMLVAESCRGKGYARTFLAIWLRLCLSAGVTPATSRINKPLLALTLVRLGFTPLRGGLRRGKPGKKRKPKQRPLAVEVSQGSEGSVLLYCPLTSETERLRAGFSATELKSQRLVVASTPPEPRGRVAHIRVRYAPPQQTASAAAGAAAASSAAAALVSPHEEARAGRQLVHAPLVDAAVGGRLRLCASQGPTRSGEEQHEQQTLEQRAEVLRMLIGRL